MLALNLGDFPNDVILAFWRQMEAHHDAVADLLVSGAKLSPLEEEELTRALIPLAAIRKVCRAHQLRLAEGELQDIRERGRMLRAAALAGMRQPNPN